MKLIIDIPEEHFKKICANKEDAIIAHDTCRRIANGTPIPDKATNGDVIKAIFPNIKIRWETVSRIGITYKNNQDYITEFDLSWWNAPYQKICKE